MTDEVWKPVVGYEGLYEVSNWGNARSLARVDAQGGRRKQRMFKPSRMDKWGHLGIKIRRDGVVKSRYVHHLVLEAFVGPRPEGMEACHWNDVADDNRLENLRWDTRGANRHDRVRNGRDQNANKNHCHRGHAFSESNTYINNGRRHCRKCQQIRHREYRGRKSMGSPMSAEGIAA